MPDQSVVPRRVAPKMLRLSAAANGLFAHFYIIIACTDDFFIIELQLLVVSRGYFNESASL